MLKSQIDKTILLLNEKWLSRGTPKITAAQRKAIEKLKRKFWREKEISDGQENQEFD